MLRMLKTERLLLKLPVPSMAPVLLDYYFRNQEFFKPFDPLRESFFYTLEHQSNALRKELDGAEADRLYRFYLFKKDEPEIIGMVGLSELVRGAFQSCFLGCKLDKGHLRQGFMLEALTEILRFAFHDLSLHRVEANVMPRNLASRNLLLKAGFKEEGRSRKYLKINGVWEDHIHYAKLADD